MKRACLFLLLLLCAGATCPARRGGLRAQISSSAFDPNCYQPRIGVPGEIDTIYGGYSGQGLGINQFSPGPGPNSPYNRIFMGGYANNPNGWDILSSGPDFNLQNLAPTRSRLKPLTFLYKGHFHSPKLTDILYKSGGIVRIYWADSEGLFDSSNFTVLGYAVRGPGNSAGHRDSFSPYIASLLSDTVDDLVLCYDAGWAGKPNSDSQFVVLYRGGASLYHPGDTVLNDDAAFFSKRVDTDSYFWRHGISGDFRGSGRKDFVAAGGDSGGTLFYFRNAPPFSLARFTDAMRQDTLYARWQNPEIPVPPVSSHQYWSLNALRALPRPKGDVSVDLIGTFVRNEDPFGNVCVNLFRGGPSFGTKRILANDTALCIRSPQYYDATWDLSYSGITIPCGDMTGTGNPLIEIDGYEPGYTHSFYYVLGEAADPLVDMYVGQKYSGSLDTVTADADRLEDVISGIPDVNGTIEVIHGSKKLPVRLNPRFAAVPVSVRTGDSLRIAPNPCSTHTVVTWESSCSGSVGLQLYDVMGRQVFQERRPTTGALESFSLDLPNLPNGEYFLVLLQEPCVQHGRIIVQE